MNRRTRAQRDEEREPYSQPQHLSLRNSDKRRARDTFQNASGSFCMDTLSGMKIDASRLAASGSTSGFAFSSAYSMARGRRQIHETLSRISRRSNARWRSR
jgi:hypothetical protein